LASSRNSYDIIAGDLFLPWGAGEGRLFSLEHFRSVRLALKDGGIFCQWLPLYQLTPEQLEVIAATFTRVFDKTHVFASPPSEARPILALVGVRGNDGLLPPWEELSLPPFPGAMERGQLESFYLGTWPNQQSTEVNTLGNLLIELDAAKERLTGEPASKYLYGKKWSEYRRGLSGKPD